MRSFKRKRQALDTLQTMILLVVGIFIALPIYLTVINTFKPSNDIIGDPLGLPIPPVMDNIVVIIEDPYANIVKMYGNTIFLMVTGTFFTIVISAMAAYYLARKKGRLGEFMKIYFLAGIMVPYVIVYLPLCILLKKAGIPLNVFSLILVMVSSSISFSVFMYTNYITTLPKELEESAAIDGATKTQTFWKILFPILRPCTAAVMIFVGMGFWNDFQTPLLMGQIQTITVGIYSAVGKYSADWGIVFAYVFFATVPVVIAYLCAQKSFVSGLTVGAIKG